MHPPLAQRRIGYCPQAGGDVNIRPLRGGLFAPIRAAPLRRFPTRKLGPNMNKGFLRSRSASLWFRAALLAAALCAGCRSLPYFVHVGGVSVEKAAPPVEQLHVDGLTASELAAGRQLYVSRCTKCHGAMPMD